MQNIISEYKRIKLKFNRKIVDKSPNTESNSVFTNNPWIRAEVSREIITHFEVNKTETLHVTM